MKNSKYGTLIVENFGPIKKAEIDLNQVMIFIGPQGSGKSALMKLISALYNFFSVVTPSKSSLTRILSDEFKNSILKRYDIDSYINKETYFHFDAFHCNWEFKDKKLTTMLDKSKENYHPHIPLYIPAERMFFAAFSNSIQTLLNNKIPIPDTLLNFGSKYEYAKKEITNLDLDFLDIVFKVENGNDFVYYDDDNKIFLNKSSSGMQSVIPMAIIIEYMSRELTRGNEPYKRIETTLLPKDYFALPVDRTSAAIIEEPELNLFPTAQKGLVDFIISRLIKYHEKPHSVIIATHSPYILTSIDNLIQAGNVYEKDPRLEKKIAKIIPKECWLDFDKVTAYYIEKGKTKSILNKTERRITADKIDKVSEDLSLDFDKLLDLKYPS